MKKTHAESLKQTIVDAIFDKKGLEVVELDLREINESIADYFILCHGESNTQVNAIAESIEKQVKKQCKTRPSHTEGKTHANWIVIDYFDVIVHVFHKETRMYYQLEELWSDAKTIEHN